ncbi:MAG TPA: Hpt domain-containing protein [Thioploca sp.]|nr:Hpt domain-containing protein [Thioploca sp.]
MSKILDLNIIEKIKIATAKRSPEFLSSLVDNFLVHSAELITEINLALEQSNIPKIIKNIHKLKGTSASFGAEELAQLCSKIETTDHAEIKPLIEQLTDCYDRTKSEIKQVFTSK